MSRLRGVHFGSYWMGENDIVHLMACDLAELCDLTVIDTGIYSHHESAWYAEDDRFSRQFPIRWLDHSRVLAAVKECSAHFVVVNAGGMSLLPHTIAALRGLGVVCIGISLSDPDVFPYHGRVYAGFYDLYYTNSLFALTHQYPDWHHVRLMPFAASPRLHRPLPEVATKYDVVVVGHGRADRSPVVDALRQHVSVGLFGTGWGPGVDEVHGEAHVRAINSGRMYLSFSRTMAGYSNVKVGLFEAAACRTPVITEHFEELSRYFAYGKEVIGFRSVRQLVKLVKRYLRDEESRQAIADNAYRRVLKQHTWRHRWQQVLDDVAGSTTGTLREVAALG